MLPPPPSYSDAIGDNASFVPDAPIGGQLNFCWNCGTPQCNKSGSTPNVCCFKCGVILVKTEQNAVFSASPSAPPSFPGQQHPIIQQPTAVFPYQGSNNSTWVAPINDMSSRIGNRLIYDFEKVGCCPGQVVGLHPEVKNQLPQELDANGITLDEWRGWMEDLMVVQEKAPSICGFLCIFCFPAGFVQACLCAVLCPISMDQPIKWLPCCYGDWYVALRKWSDDVNAVINNKGMHIKLVTYKPSVMGHEPPISKLGITRVIGKDGSYEMSFMILALTPDESEKLKMESWDHGVNDRCTSGIGRCL